MRLFIHVNLFTEDGALCS